MCVLYKKSRERERQRERGRREKKTLPIWTELSLVSAWCKQGGWTPYCPGSIPGVCMHQGIRQNRQAMSTDMAGLKPTERRDKWKYRHKARQASPRCVQTAAAIEIYIYNEKTPQTVPDCVLILRLNNEYSYLIMTRQKGKKKKKDNLNKLHGNHPLLIFLLRLKLLRICNCLCLITLAGWISIWPSAVGLREPIKDISVVQEAVEEQTPGADPSHNHTFGDRF